MHSFLLLPQFCWTLRTFSKQSERKAKFFKQFRLFHANRISFDHAKPSCHQLLLATFHCPLFTRDCHSGQFCMFDVAKLLTQISFLMKIQDRTGLFCVLGEGVIYYTMESVKCYYLNYFVQRSYVKPSPYFQCNYLSVDVI